VEHTARNARSLLVAIATIALAAAILEISRGRASLELMRYVGERLNTLTAYLRAPHMLDGPRLYIFAFAGGLVASISPCILGLLPVNLSYIGSLGNSTRLGAARAATLFVAGIGIVNTALGLISSFFFAVLIEYRGQVNIGVGLLTVFLALWMAGIVPLRMPSIVRRVPSDAGPLVVGAVLGLAVSPCSSPVLVAVLAAAGSGGHALRAVETMIVYSIGYTSVLLIASVFTGAIAASQYVLKYGELIGRFSATALGLLGLGGIFYGITLLV
jgi:cytochrome c-type biogenesis protein